ncbi:uncharacterized protein DUF349 [Pseudoduganella flava]|uniref:DUF349 domain-containing protein n=1 Tax=Pseudoduganella flava TaxID=871742 RepID=A0A562PZ96_9BURK|nr:DUF349 domain-containing protein [Pseudoduganella flava]QGZ38686.1 DUF349 domain-containing protein [Pseudoduganella flava]TWI49739.1 uncharacterized protein DUF349 [Pseudoduganella flava]
MFEFLFKRPGDKGPDAPGAQGHNTAEPGNGNHGSPHGAGDGGKDHANAVRRAEQAERAKSLAGDEAAAVELILQSEFADVRLAAAEHVVSQPMLERVQQAVRNTDRRVAKLMQQRLDAIRHRQMEQRQAEASIASAQRLLQDEKLTPNLVADLDRLWKVIDAPPELAAQFDQLRAALGGRLEAQVSLQRATIDALAALRKLAAAPVPDDPAAAQAELDRLAADHAARLAAPEQASLPRHLRTDIEQALEAARAALTRPAAPEKAEKLEKPAPAAPATTAPAAVPEREQAEASAPAPNDTDHAAPAAEPAAEAPAAAAPAPQEPPRPPKEKKLTPADREANERFMALVDAMEAALNQGQLHVAAEHDKTLKDSKTGRLTTQQADRLAHVRAEFKRLSAWARWGGNVSREELVHAVEELPAQNLSMSELAKKVSAMRERWKALDTVSGAAPKSLWEKFDAACTAAYAPAAAHFRHLADERHANAAKAQALVDEVHALAADSPAAREDWRALASSTQRLRQAWSRLGTIDRKDKKRLDTAFGKAMEALMAPLEEQRKIEVARREQLIEEVYKLNPTERHTVDTLRGLQEAWQGHAKALPLERRQEQALWQKFRAACDTIFAKRKQSAHAADHERKAHLHAREEICAQLEAFTPEGDDKAQQAAIGKALREAATAWHASGAVPRAAEQRIEQRYRAAVAKLQGQSDALRKRAGAAQANALRDKLRLTQALENALAAPGDVDADDWNGRWQALPALPSDYERTLHARFNAALQAAGGEPSARAAYAGTLESNRARLLSEVLRLEIIAGIDSGAEFARDRLKMQVEVLQNSLKSGQKAGSAAAQAAQFVELCAMPALADDRTASRIEQLFRKIGAEQAR